MSIPYRHRVRVVRQTHSGAGAPSLDAEGDDLGVPSGSERVSDPIPALIQPKSARERAAPTGEGANVGNFRIYLPIVDVGPDDVLRKDSGTNGDPDADLDGDYRILFVGNAAGMGHHLEVDVDRLVLTPTTNP